MTAVLGHENCSQCACVHQPSRANGRLSTHSDVSGGELHCEGSNFEQACRSRVSRPKSVFPAHEDRRRCSRTVAVCRTNRTQPRRTALQLAADRVLNRERYCRREQLPSSNRAQYSANPHLKLIDCFTQHGLRYPYFPRVTAQLSLRLMSSLAFTNGAPTVTRHSVFLVSVFRMPAR